jgi:hypothetical protein
MTDDNLLPFSFPAVSRKPLLSMADASPRMAALGVEAVKKFADTGDKPQPTTGKQFFDTGVALVTGKPVKGVDSIDIAAGLKKCWG